MQQLTIPQIDYDKLVVYSFNAPQLSTVKRVIPNTPYEILNRKRDRGVFVRSVAVEVDGVIPYVFDIRHSHDADAEDTTSYSTTSETETDMLTIDYGSVLNAKEIMAKVGLWNTGTIGYFNAYASRDGATWSKIGGASAISTSEVTFYVRVLDISFRYLKFTAWTASSTYSTYMRVRKIIIIT